MHAKRGHAAPRSGPAQRASAPTFCVHACNPLQFGTSFKMMDAEVGRGQTTKGIWVSKSPKVPEVATLVMDLEGSDGRERGEDDTNFERQSALFALSVADVLLVNIWCHDIGREQGSGKPLLKTIFQVGGHAWSTACMLAVAGGAHAPCALDAWKRVAVRGSACVLQGHGACGAAITHG